MLEREKILLQKALSPWPRRGHSLLDMGCGDGLFLEFFWQSGFDVTAIDRASPLLDAARQRLHGRADIQAGALDSLPFADNTFDYVAITAPLPTRAQAIPTSMGEGDTATESGECFFSVSKDLQMLSLAHAQDILGEAVRVSAKGLVLRCWNPCSLAGLWRHAWLYPNTTSRMQHNTQKQETPADASTPHTPNHATAHETSRALWLGWRDYRALLRTLSPGCTISTHSTLCGPPPTWHPGKTLRRLNEWESSLPLGAVVYLRITHKAQRPFTALPLRLSLHLKSPRTATAMECSQDDEHI